MWRRCPFDGSGAETIFTITARAPAMTCGPTDASRMDIKAMIAALGGRYGADEAEVVERVLRDHGGTIPDEQLISEAALALAIQRRSKITG